MGQSVEAGAPELHSAAMRLSAAAQRLKDGLSSVDDETTQLLGSGWQGGAASAYTPMWGKWQGGAEQVVTGLQRMSELLTIAGREYAKTDESTSGALGSTIQGAGGSEGSGGGGASGGGAGDGAGSSAGGGQATGSAEGRQQAMAAAMQLGQVPGQPLSPVGQGAIGLTQTIAGIAQQAADIADEAIQQTGAAEGDQDRQAETPDGSAVGPANSTGIAPADSASIGRADRPRTVERPGE